MKMFRQNKKAMELSINFVVLFILAIVVFGMSVFFLKDIFKVGTEFFDKTSNQLDDQMMGISCGSNQVCLSANRLEIPRGDYKVFGLKIYNYQQDTITVKVKVDMNTGTVSVADPNANLKILFGTDVGNDNARSITLNPGESKPVGILVTPNKSAKTGEYLLNVETTYKVGSTWSNFGDGKYKLYVVVS